MPYHFDLDELSSISENDAFLTDAESSNHVIPPFNQLELRFLTQNVMKSNTLQHTLLNDTLHTHQSDVLLLQEPWYGRIGSDYERQSTEVENIKHGTVNNPEWIQILPITNE
jgi:hypothetical protein